jgi:hypothetical protein
MAIPPCTTGQHSTTDLPPQIEKKEAPADIPAPTPSPAPSTDDAPARKPISAPQHAPTPPPPAPVDEENDDPSLPIPDGATCKRKACGATYKAGQDREQESCTHHPGAPIFHEGSKGYSCCKRRVLEFDEFMKIQGCKTSPRHLFVGARKDEKAEDVVESVRSDFYQTASTVIASFFLKKINKDESKVVFSEQGIELDLKTSDAPPKRYTNSVSLFGPIVPAESSYKIMGTKLEVVLVKADGAAWPVLRSDDRRTGEILQVGRAGKV